MKELLRLGSWECVFRAVLGVSFRHPLVDQSALKLGRVPHSVVFTFGGDSVCTPLANEGLGLGPSSSGPVASRLGLQPEKNKLVFFGKKRFFSRKKHSLKKTGQNFVFFIFKHSFTFYCFLNDRKWLTVFILSLELG